MPDPIRISGRFRLKKPYALNEYEKDIQPLFGQFLRQLQEDALTGTFGEFDPGIFATADAYNAFKEKADRLACVRDLTGNEDPPTGRLPFELQLAAEAFASTEIGLQKLVHVLVSDLFERSVAGLEGDVAIAGVDLGPLQQTFIDAYRPQSHTIGAIRNKFGLKQDQPLLAFTIKPRSGLTEGDYYHLSQEAFRGGCQIVEMDTRDLDVSQGDRADMILNLSKYALELSATDAPKRFSANLSGPVHAVRDLFERLSDLHKDRAADCWVVKVDGNLDGMSTIQAIRSSHLKAHSQPIITCYPVLKYALGRFLGPDTLVRLLVLSGADIIYPGGRPRFKSDRDIDGAQLSESKRHYDAMRMGDFPLLSVAGGTSIGHVHSTIALLGTDIAFFVGGGIALSKKGLHKAAANFNTAIRYALEDVRKPKWDAALFRGRYAPLTNVYSNNDIVPAQFEYVNPCNLMERKVDMSFRPKPG